VAVTSDCLAFGGVGQTAVLVMAYGGPDSLDDVEAYILDVRNHRPTSTELIEEMRSRYHAIGGRSPILEHTRAQAVRLGHALLDAGSPLPVYIGMRHWHPYIREALDAMRADGIERAVGLVMAPHQSRMSVGAYFQRVDEAAEGIEIHRIESWHLLPEYLATVESRIRESLETFPADSRDGVHILFTAHSLPERIVAEGDPYVAQLAATVAALETRFADNASSFAYQSAAMTPDPWLGPDAGEVLNSIAASGGSRVLMAPIGFTSEHVEILYDIDIEYADLARRLGIELRRIRMMNDDSHMMTGLARRVVEELRTAAV
jgi:ferrochelatase